MSLVYRNVNGKFEEVGYALGFRETFQSTSVSFADVNLDGWVDVYVANYFEDNSNQVCLPNSLYISHGGEFFTEESAKYGVNDNGCGLAISFSDFDNDGDMDIFVANDFGQNFSSNALYRNDYPEKRFTNVKDQYGFNQAILGMGVDAGDYNNDGWFDYYATNIGQNYFFENARGQNFIERGKELKIDNTKANPNEEQSGLTVSWAVNWFDFDLDMDVDLHVNNGYLLPIPGINVEYADNSRLFRNNGDGVAFTEITAAEGLLSPGLDRGAAQIDFDNDGDVDLLTTAVRPDKTASVYNDKDFFKLFENKQTSGRNWLKVDLEGSTIDRLAMGSRVKVYAGGITQMREVTSAGGGYLSQN
ncbi:MAG: CRTAC1 family protein, partial [Candidatus Kapaibacterium sp.]